MIEKTAHFLELSGKSALRFTRAASQAVVDVRASFHHRREGGRTAGGDRLAADLNKASARVTSHLQAKPRHRLFAPDTKRWLLKLAFGPQERKEAREVRAAAWRK